MKKTLELINVCGTTYSNVSVILDNNKLVSGYIPNIGKIAHDSMAAQVINAMLVGKKDHLDESV